MSTRKKLCLACYNELMPNEKIHIITLGRSCCRCGSTTPQGEIMISCFWEAVPPLPNAS